MAVFQGWGKSSWDQESRYIRQALNSSRACGRLWVHPEDPTGRFRLPFLNSGEQTVRIPDESADYSPRQNSIQDPTEAVHEKLLTAGVCFRPMDDRTSSAPSATYGRALQYPFPMVIATLT